MAKEKKYYGCQLNYWTEDEYQLAKETFEEAYPDYPNPGETEYFDIVRPKEYAEEITNGTRQTVICFFGGNRETAILYSPECEAYSLARDKEKDANYWSSLKFCFATDRKVVKNIRMHDEDNTYCLEFSVLRQGSGDIYSAEYLRQELPETKNWKWVYNEALGKDIDTLEVPELDNETLHSIETGEEGRAFLYFVVDKIIKKECL